MLHICLDRLQGCAAVVLRRRLLHVEGQLELDRAERAKAAGPPSEPFEVASQRLDRELPVARDGRSLQIDSPYIGRSIVICPMHGASGVGLMDASPQRTVLA